MQAVRKKIGLALGSGGAKGLAHIGVIKALVDHNIPIDYIAGSSAGAIVGGTFAVNGEFTHLEEFLEALPAIELIKSFSDIHLRDGIIKGTRFLEILQQLVGKVRIEECQIPFCAMASKQSTGDPVVLRKGSLACAMRASSSVPILFSPYKYSTHGMLIDGGVFSQVPVDVVKGMGADIVIGVNLAESGYPYNKRNQLSVMQNYGNLLIKGLARADCRNADIVVSPKFTTSNWITLFQQKKDVITSGYRAMSRQLGKLHSLLSTASNDSL